MPVAKNDPVRQQSGVDPDAARAAFYTVDGDDPLAASTPVWGVPDLFVLTTRELPAI